METALMERDTHLAEKELTVLEQANALAIRNQETYDRAGRFVLEYVKPLEREVKETFDPLVESTNRAHKEAVAQRNKHLGPLQNAKRIATTKCKIYEDEQARLQREEQHRKELEAKRIAEEQQLKEATQAEQMGEAPEVVNAILEEKVTPPPVVAAPTFERMKGITRKTSPKAEVINLPLLIKFVAENPQYSNYLLPNMPALDAAVNSQNIRFRVSGVRVIS